MLRLLSPLLTALIVAGIASAQTNLIKTAVMGTPEVKSIEAISFGPNGLLLIGDGKGAQVIAVDTGDTTPGKGTFQRIANIKEELAGRLGTDAKGIEINKLAVNPTSQIAYVSVRLLSSKKDVLLTINGEGKIAEFALEKVKYARFALPPGDKSPVTRITDIAWAGDRVIVAAQANETFAAKIYTIAAPLVHAAKASMFSAKTYHVAHGRWETNAPLAVLIPYEEAGKKFVVGAFTCTPIVKYGLDDLESGAKVEGISVLELGFGNTPRDMFTYQKDNKTYILMSTIRIFHKNSPIGPSPYWAAKVGLDVLKEAELINQKALYRTGAPGAPKDRTSDIAQMATDFHGVVHMDRLDNERALIVRSDGKGGYSLETVQLP